MENENSGKITRRIFLEFLGKSSVVIAVVAQAFAAIKAFMPRVLYEPPSQFKIGKPDDFPDGITFLPKHKLYLVREKNNFHVISALCTHLFCVVGWKSNRKEFYCPCHGGKFNQDGVNAPGPAPKPLPWYALSLAPDGNLVVDSKKQVSLDYKFYL